MAARRAPDDGAVPPALGVIVGGATPVPGGVSPSPPGSKLSIARAFALLTKTAISLAEMRGHVLGEPVVDGIGTISPSAAIECSACGRWVNVVVALDEPDALRGSAISSRCGPEIVKPEVKRRSPSEHPLDLDPSPPREALTSNWNVGRW